MKIEVETKYELGDLIHFRPIRNSATICAGTVIEFNVFSGLYSGIQLMYCIETCDGEIFNFGEERILGKDASCQKS